MKNLYRLILVFVVLIITSCGTMPGSTVVMAKREAAKLRPAYKKFQKLCDSENRSRWYKSASAEGYLYARTSGASCSDWHPDLIKSGYQFIECSEMKINNYDLLNRGNIFHFRIERKKYASCFNKSIEKNDSLDKSKNICLIREMISFPKSNYAYLQENGYVNENSEHVLAFPNDRKKKDLISYSGIHILNLQNYETLAIHRDYTYWPEGISMQIKFTCENENEEEIFSVRDILIP